MLHFYQDAGKQETALEDKYTTWSERNRLYSRVKLTEEEKKAKYAARRQEKLMEKQESRRYKIEQKQGHWKGKLLKHFRIWLRDTILESFNRDLSLNVAD
jgi:chromosome segregation and condensation protein ScpB